MNKYLHDSDSPCPPQTDLDTVVKTITNGAKEYGLDTGRFVSLWTPSNDMTPRGLTKEWSEILGVSQEEFLAALGLEILDDPLLPA